MPKITIDNVEVEVADGETILDAARKLGIDVPTLCYLKGYKASTSCQVCLVKLVDSGRVLPSCGMPAVDGMRVESETDEVHALRRTALELLLSDHVGDCLAPCYFACPAHMDIPKMLRDIGDEDFTSAIATIKEDIALPAVLGRVCPKPCEKGCRRSSADGPVEVCDLKRSVADQDLASDSPYVPNCKEDTGKQIVVVGAGPTGLAAAFHLRVSGHNVILIDAADRAGGRLRTDFPKDLPAEVLQGEIDVILRMGVEFAAGVSLGTDVTLSDLQNDFDAILICIGGEAKELAGDWGLKISRRGIEINAGTFETGTERVFAAGNAIRGKGLVVRSVADGKEAAAAIDEFVRGQTITPVVRPFSSRVGKIPTEEMAEFLSNGKPIGRLGEAAKNGDSISSSKNLPMIFEGSVAADQSQRCLECGCIAHGNCSLETYAGKYGADPTRYQSERRAYVKVNRSGSVIYEPGKCINCELCIQIANESEDALGLSFVGRGFDVRIGVPFHATMEEALGSVAEKCITACPTGALYFSQKQP
ncbi:NAD-dependent dihydropyrimidine dehydrogenase subunit PreT [Novipirellula aureliae]|uniref:NAD-dependent dihydropyrimidine dehydrogenase subunit PreT n=1 Tax=Novipirellula aureliae TaxID=2527966 RepID=A0A5C6DM19_9BACT|nr:2Fe-2S iron-sulfur cluster-binding protein [Novipirellula aureliae]TWU37880.1 NAD-dependent dihydropyrimidine dehydrogenase subunit PreT [Novipirellula aureliae]